MVRLHAIAAHTAIPSPGAVLELLKPVTWFAPMWAFACGMVSSGVPLGSHAMQIIAGAVLAGPLICATSQAVNDWFDRHVDAINQPDRPIPSGRVAGRWGLRIAVAWTVISLVFAIQLGAWVFWAAAAGLALAWAYSAPPLRLKQNGWLGPAAVALSYEGLTWFAGAALMCGALPGWHVLLLAALYSGGAYGIMTLNDFKAIEGDRQMGIQSLPVMLGTDRAARLACVAMTAPQILVALELRAWGAPVVSAVIAILTVAQVALMSRLLRDPRKFAPWYNASGTSLYVLGMLLAACAVGPLAGAAP